MQSLSNWEVAVARRSLDVADVVEVLEHWQQEGRCAIALHFTGSHRLSCITP
jgi:hypothetical protein